MEPHGEIRVHGWIEQRGFEVRVEAAVFFYGPDFGTGLKERSREGAQPGTDFDDGVTGADFGELQGFADDIAVHEEVLTEETFRLVTEGGEEVAGGAERERHGSAGRATFVDFVKIEKRHEVGPMGEAAFGFLFFEGGGGVVAPATLGGKSIPDQEIDVGGFSSALLNPVENLFVGTAGERTQAQGFVTDPDEMAEATVEAFTKERVVIEVKFAACMDANLVEGAGEKIKAAEFAEGGNRAE
jgi:hypothetical protein